METGSEKREAGMASLIAENGEARRAIRSYRDIEAYRRSMGLLAPLHTAARKLPKEEQWELASQLRRASKSIPANIAEGYGKKRSAREFKSFLNIALGSANEVVVHLEIAVSVGYLTAEEAVPLIEGYEIVARQLFRLIESWRDFGSTESRGSKP